MCFTTLTFSVLLSGNGTEEKFRLGLTCLSRLTCGSKRLVSGGAGAQGVPERSQGL